VLEDGLDLRLRDQRAGGVAGGADVDELDGGVGGEGGGNGGDVGGEFGSGGQGTLTRPTSLTCAETLYMP
jgi:hypothetical protein